MATNLSYRWDEDNLKLPMLLQEGKAHKIRGYLDGVFLFEVGKFAKGEVTTTNVRL
jgi:hypothetical protein